MSTLFHPIINTENKNTPIFLIDCSGSTTTFFTQDRSSLVIDYEFELAKQICQSEYKLQNANVILWSEKSYIYLNQKMETLLSLKDDSKIEYMGTYLSQAISHIPRGILSDEMMTDVIIITDGEVNDYHHDLSKEIIKLLKKKVCLRIIAIETNTNDYNKTDIQVGNRLYEVIKSSNLTRSVNKFSVYNQLKTEFINLNNPIVPNGYLPFGNQMFKITQFNDFTDLIRKIINNKDTNIMKLAYDLSFTLYHYIKDRSHHIQLSIIDMWCKLFVETSQYSQVRSLLVNEINNHIAGKTSTFTEARKTKYANVENRNVALMTNVKDSITTDPHPYDYSFLIKSQNGYYMLQSFGKRVTIKTFKSEYPNSGILHNDLVFPIMPIPNNTENAMQWLNINYSKILNCSPLNDMIKYYFLVDALVIHNSNIDKEIKNLYSQYVDIILNDTTNGQSLIQQATTTNMIKIDCLDLLSKYINLHPLQILYLVLNTFVVPKIDNKKEFLKNLIDYLQKNGVEIKDMNTYEINLITKHDAPLYSLNEHIFENTGLVCSGHYSVNEECPVCNTKISSTLLKGPIGKIILDKSSFTKTTLFYDPNSVCQLGNLNGLHENDKLVMYTGNTNFGSNYESFTLDNQIIIDPTSSSKMRIFNAVDFNEAVYYKYPFMKGLNMSNVVLAGGFCRSILLKQQMKDFDFFFYNCENYVDRLKRLLLDTMNSIKNNNKDARFAMFYKPKFNVFEMSVFLDPHNHINKDFNLDNFEKYEFLSLKNFTRRTIPHGPNYFEDNDEHGVKMLYRLQFIMCKFDSIKSIFDTFDFFPSKVAYDGQNVYFTEKSLIAYRYMINEIRLFGGSDLFRHRINKYFKYGFSIVLPTTRRNWSLPNLGNKYNRAPKENKDANIGPICFAVRNVKNNMIYINHGSNYEKQLERNNNLEQKAAEIGKVLYVSSLFCSFVSFLRYVKINEINYCFPIYEDTLSLPLDGSGKFIFKENTLEMDFIDRITSLYDTCEWYYKFVEDLHFSDYVHKVNNDMNIDVSDTDSESDENSICEEEDD